MLTSINREIYHGVNYGFVVHSIYTISRWVYNKNYIVISITDPDSDEASLQFDSNRLATLRLSFHDVTEGNKYYLAMSTEQAKEIVDFVSEWKDKVTLIAVHCMAGISRSAGVAAALSKWLNNEDSFFHENYVPNSTCKKLVLEAISGKIDYEEMFKDPDS